MCRLFHIQFNRLAFKFAGPMPLTMMLDNMAKIDTGNITLIMIRTRKLIEDRRGKQTIQFDRPLQSRRWEGKNESVIDWAYLRDTIKKLHKKQLLKEKEKRRRKRA